MSKRIKHGRPTDLVRADAFLQVIKYLEENDEQQTTINDLISKMKEILAETDSGCNPYSFPHMKEQKETPG